MRIPAQKANVVSAASLGDHRLHTEFLEGYFLGIIPLGRIRRCEDGITMKFIETDVVEYH